MALIAPRYHVGSFDDDASYLLSAKAFLSGQGLAGHLASGEPIVGLYLPGFGALLAPIVWVSPHSYLLARLLPVACYAAAFPLLWLFCRHRGMADGATCGALFVLALGPVDATFASMVMAETPFLLALLLLLLAVDRWLEGDEPVGRWGWAVLVAAATLLWLKQAGLGLVVGLVLWLPFTRAARKWVRAAFLGGGLAVSVLPALIARASVGLPLAGDRYSAELGGFYQGGLFDRLRHVLPSSTWHLLSTAIPAAVVPYLSPLPINDHWPDLWKVLSWQVTILCAVGAVVCFRRRRDVVPAMVVVYLAESVLWPFVNERRVILVLPVLVAWYAAGASALWVGIRRISKGRWAVTRAAAGILSASAVTFVPLAAQAPRDYLYGWEQSSSAPAGSRYAGLLSALGPRSAVVETGYRSTIALLSGHPTNWTSFVWGSEACNEGTVLYGLALDRAAFLILADLNKPGQVDSPCIAGLIGGKPWAVPLLTTSRDRASVYELVGPDTGNPDLASVIAPSMQATGTEVGGQSIRTWQWPSPVSVTQISVGEAQAAQGPTATVAIEVRDLSGAWRQLSSVSGGVGDCAGCHPFLLDGSGRPFEVTAVRVVVTADSRGASGIRVVPSSPASVSDVAVIGPVAPATK